MDDLRERVLTLALYIAENGATVRDAAKQFGVSKSTVHKDVTCRLKEYHTGLFERVRDVLDFCRKMKRIPLDNFFGRCYNKHRRL